MPTEKQERMARMMNLHPNKPETWPLETIEHLIWIEENRPRIELEAIKIALLVQAGLVLAIVIYALMLLGVYS